MEEVLPPQSESTSGYERTSVQQFTIFLENRVGRLNLLMRALEANAGKIVALAIEESADSALVRLICSHPDAGRAALREENFSFSETDVLAVELPSDTPHPLVTICSSLLAAEINIHYVYPLLIRPRGPAVALYVDDPTLAAQIMLRRGYTILGQSDLKVM
jgi:hypothetical protein